MKPRCPNIGEHITTFAAPEEREFLPIFNIAAKEGRAGV
jgi:hypothetical protein